MEVLGCASQPCHVGDLKMDIFALRKASGVVGYVVEQVALMSVDFDWVSQKCDVQLLALWGRTGSCLCRPILEILSNRRTKLKNGRWE